MALGVVYNQWDDPLVLEKALADGTAIGFDPRRFVAKCLHRQADRVAWIKATAETRPRGDGRTLRSIRSRTMTQFYGYQGMYGDIRGEYSKLMGLSSAFSWGPDIEMDDLLQAIVDEIDREFRWFVSVARWQRDTAIDEASAALADSDRMLSEEEFKKAQLESSSTSVRRLYNRIANQLFGEFRTFTVLKEKLE